MTKNMNGLFISGFQDCCDKSPSHLLHGLMSSCSETQLFYVMKTMRAQSQTHGRHSRSVCNRGGEIKLN